MSLETFGSYQLIKRLATGGMAQIYLARQLGLEGFEKLLVVKRILPHLAENEEFVRMFLDEARIAARLNHPNIVQIFNLGQQDDSFFIAMEYIHGEDARRVWKRADKAGTPLPIPLACRVVMDACAGLDYAHKKLDPSGKPLGIVHRDISPQNILVTFEGGVKVVDFGIAKAADQATVTRSGVLKGKYSYMSPEQASGQKLDARSDIFALGVVLHELLTGVRLFKRPSDMQTLKAVMACEVEPPSRVNPRVSADLDPIVMKALAPSPEERFQEAVELQIALEDWLIRHRLPSSSAHLAAFMQALYAERLEREAREGRVLVEEARSVPAREAGPRSKSPAPGSGSASSSGSGSSPGGDPDSTTAERPGARATRLAGPTGHPTMPATPNAFSAAASSRRPPPKVDLAEMSLTETAHVEKRKTPRALWLLGACVVLAAAGWFSYPFWQGALGSLSTPTKPIASGNPSVAAHAPTKTAPKPASAVVRVVTVPPGASVEFRGQALKTSTPCVLPSAPPGSYPLRLTKQGFRPEQTPVHVPATGPMLVRVLLTPLSPTVESASTRARPARVHLSILSTPPGARLWVDGHAHGKTPARILAGPGGVLDVKLEKRGYRTLERRIRVGEARRQSERLVLDHEAPPAPQWGTVRFAVTPWAHVRCGTRDLGSTPFPDQKLPVGKYRCVFTNGARSQSRTIQVLPNRRIVVQVKFD